MSLTHRTTCLGGAALSELYLFHLLSKCWSWKQTISGSVQQDVQVVFFLCIISRLYVDFSFELMLQCFPYFMKNVYCFLDELMSTVE